MIGKSYLFDNRHFINMPLSKKNLSVLPISKESTALKLISMELLSCHYNPEHFEVKNIRKIKAKGHVVYIVQDTRSQKGFGVVVVESEVRCFNIKGYEFTDPFNSKNKIMCRDAKDALDKTGKIKEKDFE